MTSETISQTVLFPELLDKLLVVAFDRPRASSDRGAVGLSYDIYRPGVYRFRVAFWPVTSSHRVTDTST